MFAHSQLTPFVVGCLPPQCPSKFRISAVKRLSSNIFVRYVTYSDVGGRAPKGRAPRRTSINCGGSGRNRASPIWYRVSTIRKMNKGFPKNRARSVMNLRAQLAWRWAGLRQSHLIFIASVPAHFKTAQWRHLQVIFEVRKYGNEEEDAPTISIVTQNEWIN